jgi:glycerate-2-kinase
MADTVLVLNSGSSSLKYQLVQPDAGVSLADCLDRNDAVGFFDPLGDLFTTGPTHTNVNDFRALLVL